MSLTTIVLDPYAQGNGVLQDPEVSDPPVLVGGGSLSDGSDSTYVEQGAWQAFATNDHHAEPFAVYFKTPAGFDPQYIALQARMRSDAYVLANTPDGSRQLYHELKSPDASVLYDYEIISGSDILDDIIVPATPDFGWFTWWAQNNTIDLDNPASENGWYRLDWDYSNDEGDKAALAGDGLRIDVGMYFDPTASPLDTRFAWIDWAEFRLLVAGEGSSTAPLRRYPPVNNGGSGPTRHWPRTVNRRAGGTY